MRTEVVSFGIVMIGLGALGAVYRTTLTRFFVKAHGRQPLDERQSRFTIWLLTMSLIVALMGIGAIAAGLDTRPRP